MRTSLLPSPGSPAPSRVPFLEPLDKTGKPRAAAEPFPFGGGTPLPPASGPAALFCARQLLHWHCCAVFLSPHTF